MLKRGFVGKHVQNGDRSVARRARRAFSALSHTCLIWKTGNKQMWFFFTELSSPATKGKTAGDST